MKLKDGKCSVQLMVVMELLVVAMVAEVVVEVLVFQGV